jgi:hypothetical protein
LPERVTCAKSPGDDFENMREALGVDLLFNSIPVDAFSQSWSTQIVDVRRGQLLDVVPGRTAPEPCR